MQNPSTGKRHAELSKNGPKQTVAIQKQMEEDRYTAINQLLEMRRRALEHDSEE